VKRNVTTREYERSREYELLSSRIRAPLLSYSRTFSKLSSPESVGAPDGRIGDCTTVSPLIFTSGFTKAGVAGIKGVKDTDVPDVRPRLVRGTGDNGLKLRRLEPIERGVVACYMPLSVFKTIMIALSHWKENA
jgi:hypothetical protein